ncbi:MAG: serine hydrolase domain-containing protein [Ilumatobacteraceae bacterium]
MLHGEPVVDLWGGWADHERTKPWEADTIVNVWSTTKTMMAISALVLVDRGELDPYQKVSLLARVRPAGQAGHRGATPAVAHIGVSGWTSRWWWRTSTTGSGRRRCWRRRHRGGNRVPRPVITRSTRDTWSAR